MLSSSIPSAVANFTSAYVNIICLTREKYNMFNARKALDKAILVGGSRADPPTLRRFYNFFPKKYAFLGTF